MKSASLTRPAASSGRRAPDTGRSSAPPRRPAAPAGPAALAQHHADHALVQAHIQRAHADQLGHAQAGGVQRFQHGPVAQATGLFQVGARSKASTCASDRILGMRGACLAASSVRQGSRSAMLAQGPGVEAAQRRQPPVGRGRAGLFVAEREPGFDVGLAGLRQRPGRPGRQRLAAGRLAVAVGHLARVAFRVFQPAREAGQVAPIGRQRIGGQAVLQPDGVDESVDVGLGSERRAGLSHEGGMGRRLAHILRIQRAPTPAAAAWSQASNSSASERSLRCG